MEQNKKRYTITVRFNKEQYMALLDVFWKTRKYIGVIAREATMEYLRTNFGKNLPAQLDYYDTDEEKKA